MNALRRRMRRRAGFTLVEMMVAMVIGLAVVGASYYITRTTARMFAEQLRRAETQLTLRGAIELLRRDISRAGFASVRSTAEMPGCNNNSAANGWIGTLGALTTDVSPVALAAAWIGNCTGRPCLYLSGNFTTSEQYVVDGNNSTALTLQLDTTQHMFMRSFLTPFPTAVPNTFLPNRFIDAFLATRAGVTGRMVNVLDLVYRKSFLRAVTAVNPNAASPQVTLETALPSGQPNEAGCILDPRHAMVAPISTFVYEVVNTADDAEVAAAVSAVGTLNGAYMTGGARLVLVRREVNMADLGVVLPPAAPARIAGTTRAIVDFLEPQDGFTIEAVYDSTQQNMGNAPVLQRTAPPTNTNPPALESLRSLVIQIIARSAENVPADGPERGRAFAGRRVARFEVFMPNMSRNPGTRP